METKTATEQVAGLNIYRNETEYDFKVLERGSRDGSLYDFNLVGLKALSDAVDRLPKAEMAEVVAKDGSGDYSEHRVIRNAETKTPYGFTGPDYHILQPSQVFAPALEVAQSLGLNVASQLESQQDGRVIKGRVLLSNPEYVFQVLGGPDERLGLVLRLKTSHAMGALRVEPGFLRALCCNLGIILEQVEPLSISHTTNADERVNKMEGWIQDDLLPTIPNLKETMDKAAQVDITPVEVGLAQLGAEFGPRSVADFMGGIPGRKESMVDYEPRFVDSPSLYNGFNATTAFLSHSDRFNTTDRREELTARVGAFLTPTKFDALVGLGRHVAAGLQQKRDEQVAIKARSSKGDGARITVPLIPGIIHS